MNKSQSNYSGGKKPDRKEYSTYYMVPFTLNSKKCKHIYSNGKQTNGSRQQKDKTEEPRGTKKLWEIMAAFIILTVVVVSQVYAYVKIAKLYTSNRFS